MGVIVDIEEEKRQELIIQAQNDGLTGLLAFLPGVSDQLAAELVDKIIMGMNGIRPKRP
ncbi:hypothetical protein [Robinsoniella peoriensis]|uniref:hypothetical protein n=1 Tax=Robinsoniella peoriensis TaxID=180332 RepID=UPI00362695AA